MGLCSTPASGALAGDFAAMQVESTVAGGARQPWPRAFEACCGAAYGTADSFAYRLAKGETASVPWLVEAAYAPGTTGRALVTGSIGLRR